MTFELLSLLQNPEPGLEMGPTNGNGRVISRTAFSPFTPTPDVACANGSDQYELRTYGLVPPGVGLRVQNTR
jgi:hypothetical protein